MKVMKVNETMYEVHDDKRRDAWWTASNATGHWFVMTGKTMRSVDPDGRIGKRVIAAVEAHIAK